MLQFLVKAKLVFECSFIVITIVNDDCKKFIVQAIVNTVVNYNYKTFTVQTIVITIVNYNLKTFTVQATEHKMSKIYYYTFWRFTF